MVVVRKLNREVMFSGLNIRPGPGRIGCGCEGAYSGNCRLAGSLWNCNINVVVEVALSRNASLAELINQIKVRDVGHN